MLMSVRTSKEKRPQRLWNAFQKKKITKPRLLCALLATCLYYSGLVLIMLLYLNDTKIIDCISTEGKSHAMVFLCWANEHGDEPHTPVHQASSESCCFWLFSALLNKARWAGRDRRV